MDRLEELKRIAYFDSTYIRRLIIMDRTVIIHADLYMIEAAQDNRLLFRHGVIKFTNVDSISLNWVADVRSEEGEFDIGALNIEYENSCYQIFIEYSDHPNMTLFGSNMSFDFEVGECLNS